MIRTALVLLALCIGFLTPAIAIAEDEAGSGGYFQVIPRVWYGMSPDKVQSGECGPNCSWTDTIDADNEIKYGASLVWGPANSNADYVLTVYYGQKDVNFTEEFFCCSPGAPAGYFYAHYEQRDVDVELLRRSRLSSGALFLPESLSTQLLYGVRYLYHGEDYPVNDVFDGFYSITQHSVFAEVGASTSYPLTQDRLHNLVASATVGLGAQFSTEEESYFVESFSDSSTDFTLRWEVAAGYQWQFSENWGLIARYRAFFGYEPEYTYIDDISILHGPEAGISYTFR